MDNQEFQEIVLEELRGLREDIQQLENSHESIEEMLKNLELIQQKLANRLEQLEKKIDEIYEETVHLNELGKKVNDEFHKLSETQKSITEVVEEHEIEISTLRRKSL